MAKSETAVLGDTGTSEGEGERLLAEHRTTASKARELLPLILTEEVRSKHMLHWIVLDVETRSFVIAETAVEALSIFRNQHGSDRRAWTEQIVA